MVYTIYSTVYNTHLSVPGERRGGVRLYQVPCSSPVGQQHTYKCKHLIQVQHTQQCGGAGETKISLCGEIMLFGGICKLFSPFYFCHLSELFVFVYNLYSFSVAHLK